MEQRPSLRCPSYGALGTFLLSDTAASPRSWEPTARKDAAFATDPDEDAYVVLGTDGSRGVPTMRLKRYGRSEDRSWFEPLIAGTLPPERADPPARRIAHFSAVIRGEAAPLVTGRDGLQNLRVTAAIVEAARSGRTVTVATGRGAEP